MWVQIKIVDLSRKSKKIHKIKSKWPSMEPWGKPVVLRSIKVKFDLNKNIIFKNAIIREMGWKTFISHPNF